MKFIITESVEVILNGQRYLLEEGDTIEVVEPMFPIQYARNRLKEEGFPDSLDMIGHGENGYAFDAGDKIIKITSDKGEYLVARKLLGLDTPYVVKIYDAIKVTDKFDGPPDWWTKYWGSPMPGWEELQNLYIIVSEKVATISDADMDKIDKMIESGVVNKITSQTKLIEKLISKLGFRLYDLRADNLGYGKDGNLKLLDVGGNVAT
jgi:hypothetical protein